MKISREKLAVIKSKETCDKQADEISDLKNQLVMAKSKHDSLIKEVNRLEKEGIKLENSLSETRKASSEILKRKVKKPKLPPADKTRVWFADVHGANMDKPAVDAMLNDLSIIDPNEIVIGGDLVEVGGFLANHHSLGYVSLTKYSYEEDIAAGNWLLDEVQKRCPTAKILFIEGNHELRVTRWALTQVQRSRGDLDGLIARNHPKSLLQLKDRGIEYFDRDNMHMGIPIQGTIKLGNCYFTHGISIAANAARVHVNKFKGNVVYGDTHRRDSHTINTVSDRSITADNPGCLCTLQPVWRNTSPTDWTHGYAIQEVAKSGQFQHINVKIVNGVSLLMPLLGK